MGDLKKAGAFVALNSPTREGAEDLVFLRRAGRKWAPELGYRPMPSLDASGGGAPLRCAETQDKKGSVVLRVEHGNSH
jgi:hypothetical protein